MVLKVKKQLIEMLRRIKVETKQLLFDMLRLINVIENEETSNRYVKKDKCVENEKKKTNWYVEKDKSWNLAAAIWYGKMGNFYVVQFSQYFADSPKPRKLKSTNYLPSLTNRLFTFIQNNNCVFICVHKQRYS